MGMMVRVDLAIRCPALLQGGKLPGEAGSLLWRHVLPARLRLMVNERGSRFVQRLPASAIQAQAEIDIVEGDQELRLVEAADCLELAPLDHQTGGGYRAHKLRQARALEIARIVSTLKAMRMTGRSADAKHDAGMLD
jgi:hypothetical protein